MQILTQMNMMSQCTNALGHRAAAQFQGLGNLLIASERDNTKLNTPAPHSHLRPCYINESRDTGERKWRIGPNVDIFT